MSNQSNADASGAFTRAFLPGLILGLVVGGLAGAFLPDLLGGRSMSPIERDPNAVVEPRGDEGGSVLTPEQQAQIDEAREDAAGMIDDAAETTEDAVDDAAEAVNEAVDDLTGDDQP